MKNHMILLFALLTCHTLVAQPPNDTKLIKEKMSPFLTWVGNWKGTGSTTGRAETKTTVDEKIETKLDNTIVVVEGLGKSLDPATNTEKVVHNAYGILSFDPVANTYKFKTFLWDGRSTDAWFNLLSNSNYQWGFDTPANKIRYTITLKDNKWNEIGEISSDGNNWRKFFEMNLTKVD
jgi:hypothetical protein